MMHNSIARRTMATKGHPLIFKVEYMDGRRDSKYVVVSSVCGDDYAEYKERILEILRIVPAVAPHRIMCRAALYAVHPTLTIAGAGGHHSSISSAYAVIRKIAPDLICRRKLARGVRADARDLVGKY